MTTPDRKPSKSKSEAILATREPIGCRDIQGDHKGYYFIVSPDVDPIVANLSVNQLLQRALCLLEMFSAGDVHHDDCVLIAMAAENLVEQAHALNRVFPLNTSEGRHATR